MGKNRNWANGEQKWKVDFYTFESCVCIPYFKKLDASGFEDNSIRRKL